MLADDFAVLLVVWPALAKATRSGAQALAISTIPKCVCQDSLVLRSVDHSTWFAERANSNNTSGASHERSSSSLC